MKRTTIFADSELLEELQVLAQTQGQTTSELIRQVLRDYVTKKRKSPPKLSFMGAGASGKRDIATKHEELLWRKSRP